MPLRSQPFGDNACIDMRSRIGDMFVGGVLVIAGIFMLYAFQFLVRRGHDTWFDIAGMALIVETYSIVASMSILLGFRYIFGPQSFVERAMAQTTRHFVVAVILLSIAIAVAGVFLLWPV